MAQIIAIQEYLEQKRLSMLHDHALALDSLRISDTDIYGRDYARIEDIVYGVIKVREIMEAHFPYQEEWKHYLLELLEATYRAAGAETPRLHQAIETMKDHIRREMYAANRKDLDAAVLILDLIQNAPAHHRRMGN